MQQEAGHLHIPTLVKAVKLVQELKHGALDLSRAP
jgi:hypothetical protein